MKHLLRALVLLLCMAGLAGCFRVDGALTLAPDGASVSGEVTVAVARQWAQDNGEDLEAIVAGIESDLAANPDQGVSGERFETEDHLGITLSLADTPVERLEAATSGALRISGDDQEFTVVADLAGLAEAEGSEGWSADLALTFPEGVTRHDGDLEGSTVTWQLDADDPALRATGPTPGASTPFPWIPVSAGLILLGGVGFALMSWRQRRSRT
ncbi:hypothetical protein LQF12_14610 [Ruania suaedae]|uniref:LppM family (lipo)protein n=1 Tax=Ruania suaedae TaxID=2897774 RepID=UPI001E638AEB|nr:hypothetical protein [Ruania suaedae]UFU02701.1 hypothetical protein LQF12_14610 [Ruania suaedae]